MVKFENLEGRFKDEIVSAADMALKNVSVITNLTLQNCVKKKLEKSGTIRIRRSAKEDNVHPMSHDCYHDTTIGAQNQSYYFRIFEIHSKTISLCIENLERGRRMDVLWKYILHEFAHSCKWEHGENKGVPFPDGYPPIT